MNRYDVLDADGGTVTVLDREDEWEFVFNYNPHTRELRSLRESHPHRARDMSGLNTTVQRVPSMTVYLILEEQGFEARRFYD